MQETSFEAQRNLENQITNSYDVCNSKTVGIRLPRNYAEFFSIQINIWNGLFSRNDVLELATCFKPEWDFRERHCADQAIFENAERHYKVRGNLQN